ncbi:MAG: SPFH domain-containing protein [Bacteroidota bacterium]
MKTSRFSLSMTLLLILCMGTSCMIIRQGEVGVKRKLGRIDENVLMEGPRGYNPFTSVIFRVPVQTVNREVSLALPSKEGLTIQAVMSILYHVNAKAAPTLLKEIGRQYEGGLIMPVFRSAAADVSSRFMAKDMHSGARSAIEHEISTRMNEILEEKGITVENVLMKSIKLPTDLSNAIEEKLRAEQEAQRMEFIKQQQEIEAQRRIIEAKGERDARIIAAEAEKRKIEIEAEGQANATKLQAEAQSQANKQLSESLTMDVLRYHSIDAYREVSKSTNSKLIITPTAAPFLGLSDDILKK